MKKSKNSYVPTRRVDLQAALFAAALVVLSCVAVFSFSYQLTYRNVLSVLTQRVYSIAEYAEGYLNTEAFDRLRTADDMSSALYEQDQRLLNAVRISTGVRYLYTATQTEDGDFIYLVDGLNRDAEDYRYPGDPIEPEIIPELVRAMAGEEVLPRDIKHTDWGNIFIAYLPVHDGARVVGVIGVEFEAESQYRIYQTLRMVTPLIILAACLLAALFSFFFFRRISNPAYRDMANTDQLTQLKNRNAFNLDFQNMNASRQRETTGILLADLNHLKAVNDALGHQFGDEYLCLAAKSIQAAAHALGIPYRVGGDEFVVLAAGADLAHLSRLADEVAAHFARVRPDWPVDTGIAVGVACFDPATDQDLAAVYHRADEMMYEQKKHGGRHVHPL